MNELYVTLSGKQNAPGGVDAVSAVAVLGGMSRKTARQWYDRLHAMGWSSAFTPGQSSIVAGAKQEKELAVGSPEVAFGTFGSEAALPDVLPAVVDVVESEGE